MVRSVRQTRHLSLRPTLTADQSDAELNRPTFVISIGTHEDDETSRVNIIHFRGTSLIHERFS